MEEKEYCSPCAKLREESTEFIQNGVTDSVCKSLGKNSGFNGESENCEDLKDANWCLIKNLFEQLPAFDNCDWKEFMERFIPNQFNINESLICWLCGIQKLISNVNGLISQNLSVDLRGQSSGVTEGNVLNIDRQGNFSLKTVDWITIGSKKYGEGTLTGKVEFCMSVQENQKVTWNIKSVTLHKYDYKLIDTTGSVSSPSVTIRVPDSNGTVVYQKNKKSSFTDTINKTIQFSKTGEIGANQNSGWITFVYEYGDWVEDGTSEFQIKFSNGNLPPVPLCN